MDENQVITDIYPVETLFFDSPIIIIIIFFWKCKNEEGFLWECV